MNKSKFCVPFSRHLFTVLATLLFVLFSRNLSAQINFNNPGLNGSSAAGAAPPQWAVCASTPDIQPGQWCVETPPHEGTTYAGFADGEFLGQRLNCALVEGKNYFMSLWLAYDPDYASAQTPLGCTVPRGNPGNFQLWAGTVNCSKQELLYESGTLDQEHEENWVKHDIRFKPNNTYDFILVCVSDESTSANILVDNISQEIVQEPDSFSVDNSNIVCFGDETATATVFPPNIGGSDYSYLWNTSPAQTTQTATGLGAGTYTCTITDNNGPCTATYDVTVTVTGPPELLVNMVCNDVSALPVNGSVAAVPSGGVPPYTYSWSSSSTTDSVLNDLDAENYEVTVTDSKGCTVTGSCEILNPLCDIEITDTSFENPSCFEANDGSASISVSSSNTPISYEWNTTPVRTTATIDDLGPGDYTVVATDAENCTVTQTFTLTEPPALTLSLSGDSASCFGATDAQALAEVTGGTPDYSYNWPGSNTETYEGPAGEITCTVTDANGCEVTETITLGEPTEIALTAETTNASCPEVADGEITAAASGGFSPYEYGFTPNNLQSNPAFFNLQNGTYQLFVSDVNGCLDSLDLIVGSDSANVVAPNDTIICEGQEVFLEATGMSTMSWTGGGNSFTNGSAVTPSVTTQYVVLGSETNGCEDTDTLIVTVEPDLDPTIQAAGPFCDGSDDFQLVTADAGGIWSGPGVTPSGVFQPSTLTSGTYEVKYEFEGQCGRADSIEIIISSDFDATINPVPTLCEGDDPLTLTSATPGGLWFGIGMQGQNTDSLSPVFNPGVAGGGTHTITHIIEGACGDTATLDIVVTAADIGAIQPVPDFCPTGATQRLTATPTGGQWSGPGISPSGDFDPTAVPGPGDYQVTYTPSGTCVVHDEATITVVTQVTLADATIQLDCFGDNNGVLNASVTGGQSPYQYDWNHDNSLAGATATGLAAGSYPLTVTDNLGCSDSKTLLVNEPAALQFASSPTIVDDPCFGSCQGAASFDVTGGTAASGYTYSLNGNAQSSNSFTNLCAGNYTALITDDNGCELEHTFTIQEPAEIVATETITPDFCNQSIGAIDIAVSGGAPPYTFSWDNGATSEDISGLSAGDYTVTITDNSGCEHVATWTVPNTSGPVLSTSTTPVTCFGGNDGQGTVTVDNGGTAPFTFAWDNGVSGSTATGLSAGDYTVTVTDAQGCAADILVTISEPSIVVVEEIADQLLCDGEHLNLPLTATGGNGGPYTFTNNGNPQSNPLNASTPRSFSIVATDNLGCNSAPMDFDLNYRDPLSITYDPVVVCPGEVATIEVEAAGGIPGNYIYTWSNGTTGNPTTYQTRSNQSEDEITLTLSDNCSTPLTEVIPISYYANTVPVVNPSSGCVPLDVNFRLESNNYTEINWDFGDGNTAQGGITQDHTYNRVGDYAVTVGVVTTDGCENQVTVDGIAVYPNPDGFIIQNPSRLTEANTEASFSFTGSNISNGSWLLLDDEDTLANTTVLPFIYNFPRDTASYALQAVMISERGCTTPINKTVIVHKEVRIFIPNAFTPDIIDGTNDVFGISSVGIETQRFKIDIYNRWGERMYSSSDVDFTWDGRYRGDLVKPGVYTWVISYDNAEGETEELNGTVMVLQ